MRLRFDRGTLVFDQVSEREDPSILVGATRDRELGAWRLPADRLSGARVRLSAAGVRVSDEVRTARLDGEWALPALRWYQQHALDAWRRAGDRGVIALPTGAGKTLVAIGAMAALGVATLVIVPTRVLLDQWARTLALAWPHPIGRLGDGDHTVAPITVATYASTLAWAPRIGDRFGLAVVDEAHHVGAWCPGEIFEMLVAPARLGLTATPPAPGGALEHHVGDVAYALGVADLVGDALASFEVVTVPIELLPDERAAYQAARREFSRAFAKFQRDRPGSPWREFAKASRRTADGRAALAAWRASRAVLAYPAAKRAALCELLERHAGERVLVFTADNATAYAIARELLVMPVTCDIGRAERAEMLERFRAGDASVLVSAQVLDEGLDVPEADVAIIVGGTASVRRHVQRVGRVLRPRPDKRAKVYELATRATAETGQVIRRRRGLEPRDAMEARP
ncbi:MAG TPA: DEAD/DEAH box helicase family protein [Kofleriaceae bacterium]